MQNDKEKFKKEFQQRLINFSLKIIRIAEQLKENRIYWSIADQLIRSGTSIGANIIEAKGSSSRRDYIKFFEISLKSANETEYWLIIVKNIAPQIDELIPAEKDLAEITKIIASSILTLKGKR